MLKIDMFDCRHHVFLFVYRDTLKQCYYFLILGTRSDCQGRFRNEVSVERSGSRGRSVGCGGGRRRSQRGGRQRGRAGKRGQSARGQRHRAQGEEHVRHGAEHVRVHQGRRRFFVEDHAGLVHAGRILGRGSQQTVQIGQTVLIPGNTPKNTRKKT